MSQQDQKVNNPIYTPLNKPDSKEKSENSTNNKEDEYEWGKHPNSIKALKKHQYPKGVSVNIMGRKPTFELLKKNLCELGEQETFNRWKDNESEGTRKSQVLERIWDDAIRGDFKKIQLLAWLGCLD